MTSRTVLVLCLIASLAACGGGGSEEPVDCAAWLADHPSPPGGVVGAGAAVWAAQVPDHCWTEKGFQP